MESRHFSICGIRNFTPNEIEDTGARLSDVKITTISALQRFRTLINRRVKLCHNGITSGEHKSKAHPNGYAVDIYLPPEDGTVLIQDVFKKAIEAGFKAIGIYWNQTMYSFHFEIENPYRDHFAFWLGVKDKSKGVNYWQWHKLIRDPKDISIQKT